MTRKYPKYKALKWLLHFNTVLRKEMEEIMNQVMISKPFKNVKKIHINLLPCMDRTLVIIIWSSCKVLAQNEDVQQWNKLSPFIQRLVNTQSVLRNLVCKASKMQTYLISSKIVSESFCHQYGIDFLHRRTTCKDVLSEIIFVDDKKGLHLFLQNCWYICWWNL